MVRAVVVVAALVGLSGIGLVAACASLEGLTSFSQGNCAGGNCDASADGTLAEAGDDGASTPDGPSGADAPTLMDGNAGDTSNGGDGGT